MSKALKALTAKQRKIIIASFCAQILAQTDECMFGDKSEYGDEYISEEDQEKILNGIQKEAVKYANNALGFDNVGNAIKLIKTVREQVK